MAESTNPEKKKGLSTIKIVLLVLVGLVVIGQINRLTGGGTTKGEATSTATPAASVTEEPRAGITMASYNALQDGMSYEDACAVLGEKGEEVSSNSIGGVKTVMYKWEGPGFGANMNAMFQNNKLMSKSQFGLK